MQIRVDFKVSFKPLPGVIRILLVLKAMSSHTANHLDRALAAVCANCPACRHARKTQKGPVFSFVKKVEGRLCPFCQAYERVYGRKSYQAVPEETS